MEQWLNSVPIGILSPAALAGAAVWMIFRGALVVGPQHRSALAEQKRHYDAVIEMKDLVISMRDAEIADWRSAAQVSSAQVTTLLGTRDVGIAVAQSIQKETQAQRKQDRGEHV